MDPIYSLKLPPKSYRRTIEKLSITIPDPVVKLKFLKQAINEYQKISSQGNLKSSMAGIAFQQKLLDNAEELWPGSKKAAKNLIHTDVIAATDIKSRRVSKLRYVIGSAILMLFILGVGSAFSPWVHNLILGAPINRNSQQVKPTITKIIIRKPVIYSQPSNGQDRPPSAIVISAIYQNSSYNIPIYLQSPILLALASQQTKISTPDRIAQKPDLSSRPSESESHSPSSIGKPAKYKNKPEQDLKYFQNPILLALTYQKAINTESDRITARPLFSTLPLGNAKPWSSAIVKPEKHQIEPVQVPEYLEDPIWLVEKTIDREFYSNRLQIIIKYTMSNIPREYYRFPKNSDYMPVNSKITDKISGILFHASESDLYPFMPEMNRSILKYSKQLIKYLLLKKSYHYLIDRFVRVYRLFK